MKIGKFRILKEETFLGLIKDSKNWKEHSTMDEDNKIMKKKEELKERYKKYFGRSYQGEEGIVFTIDGIYYDRYSYEYNWENKFKFSTYAENNPDWDWEAPIDSIVEGEYPEVKTTSLSTQKNNDKKT